jgi:hypothetical protein
MDPSGFTYRFNYDKNLMVHSVLLIPPAREKNIQKDQNESNRKKDRGAALNNSSHYTTSRLRRKRGRTGSRK